jgi:hypothetical protein
LTYRQDQTLRRRDRRCAFSSLGDLDRQFVVVAALFFGAAKGAVDVGINAQAVVVEKCYGRPIMSSFQALWSVGGLAGGFLTSAALGLGCTETGKNRGPRGRRS